MTREFEFYHGVVFSRLIHSVARKVSVARFSFDSNAGYIIDQRVGLYVKYSAKRMSPWRFTFRAEHQQEIEVMQSELRDMFVVLVCNDDGIVCMSYEEVSRVIANDGGPVQWVSVSRGTRQMYSVTGSHGALQCKIGVAAFPGKMY